MTRKQPYVYNYPLKGIPEHERGKTKPEPRPWTGRYHRFVEPRPKGYAGVRDV